MSIFFGGTGGDGEAFSDREDATLSWDESCFDWKMDPPSPKPIFDCSGEIFAEFTMFSFNFEVREGEGEEFPGRFCLTAVAGDKGNVADLGGGVGLQLD